MLHGTVNNTAKMPKSRSCLHDVATPDCLRKTAARVGKRSLSPATVEHREKNDICKRLGVALTHAARNSLAVPNAIGPRYLKARFGSKVEWGPWKHPGHPDKHMSYSSTNRCRSQTARCWLQSKPPTHAVLREVFKWCAITDEPVHE